MATQETTAAAVDAPALAIHAGERTYTVLPDDGAVTVGREFPAQVLIDDPHVSRTHLVIEATGHGWTGTDKSRNGVFVDGVPKPSFAITDGLTARLGHPDGVSVRFGFAAAPEDLDTEFDDEEDGGRADWADDEDVDPNLLRVGRAVAARRRELDLAQRTLARDKVINAGTLIDFEKGRRWPREGTRARLEQVLGWAPGTIERIRNGGAATPDEDGERTEMLGGTTTVEAKYLSQAVELALNTIRHTIAALPAPTAPDFAARAREVLRDLRKLEVVATNASRGATGAPQVVMILSSVRQAYRDLMLRAARSPQATFGQTLYAARQRSELSVAEAAGAAGVTPEVIVAAESDDELTAPQQQAVQRLVTALGR